MTSSTSFLPALLTPRGATRIRGATIPKSTESEKKVTSFPQVARKQIPPSGVSNRANGLSIQQKAINSVISLPTAPPLTTRAFAFKQPRTRSVAPARRQNGGAEETIFKIGRAETIKLTMPKLAKEDPNPVEAATEYKSFAGKSSLEEKVFDELGRAVEVLYEQTEKVPFVQPNPTELEDARKLAFRAVIGAQRIATRARTQRVKRGSDTVIVARKNNVTEEDLESAKSRHGELMGRQLGIRNPLGLLDSLLKLEMHMLKELKINTTPDLDIVGKAAEEALEALEGPKKTDESTFQ